MHSNDSLHFIHSKTQNTACNVRKYSEIHLGLFYNLHWTKHTLHEQNRVLVQSTIVNVFVLEICVTYKCLSGNKRDEYLYCILLWEIVHCECWNLTVWSSTSIMKTKEKHSILIWLWATVKNQNINIPMPCQKPILLYLHALLLITEILNKHKKTFRVLVMSSVFHRWKW